MKTLIKRILLIIRTTFNLMLWSLRQALNEDFKNYIPNKTRTKPIIILGNGPSLIGLIENENFNKIRENYHFCVVNFSILSPFFQQLKPEYITIADPLFFERPIKDENVKLFIKELEKINWNIYLIVPFIFYKKLKQELINLTYVTIIPIHTNIISKSISNNYIRNLIYKKGLSCPRIQNVIVACIYSMINFGYKQIYLYGVDHSWTSQLCVNKHNQVCMKDKHFYDDENIELKPYLKCSGEEYKMHELLRDFAYMFESYHELQSYSEYLKNVKIINKSPDSFIDAFIKE